jgi:hypothetical protein
MAYEIPRVAASSDPVSRSSSFVLRSNTHHTSRTSMAMACPYRVLCRFEGGSDGVAGGVRARASDVPLEFCVFCNKSMIASS